LWQILCKTLHRTAQFFGMAQDFGQIIGMNQPAALQHEWQFTFATRKA
jgi:hypothetical protein